MNDLDNALRAMLRERAADISTLPADFADLPSLDVLTDLEHEKEHHRSRWLTFAAAAAIVAGVAGGTVTLSHRGTHHTPPGTPAPHSTAPAPHSTAPPPRTTACLTALPTAWTTASKGSTLGATSALALSVFSTGAVLATRDFGDKRDVVLARPGSAPSTIFTVPNPDQKQVLAGSVEGKWAVIPISQLPRNANGVLPTVTGIVLVDTTTRATRTLVTISDAEYLQGKTNIDGVAVQDGHVYWDVRSTFASKTGTIQDYDIATGKVRTLFSGVVTAPQAGVRQVFWSDGAGTSSVKAATELPPVVVQSTRGWRAAVSISTDGSAWAWIDSETRIGWWAPGATAATYLVLPPAAAPGANPATRVLISGNYVYLDKGRSDGSYYVVDRRTGAVAKTTAMLQYAASGVFAGTGPAATKIDPPTTTMIDTAKLPGLHC